MPDETLSGIIISFSDFFFLFSLKIFHWQLKLHCVIQGSVQGSVEILRKFYNSTRNCDYSLYLKIWYVKNWKYVQVKNKALQSNFWMLFSSL